MKSVVSYPERGNYGRSNWRGNTSGLIIKDLIQQFGIKTFIDVCEGSGTSGDVCKELGVKYLGLDLHKMFDFTKHSVRKQALSFFGSEVDMVFSHFPYFTMIDYAAERVKHGKPTVEKANDTSLITDYDEFIEMSALALSNQREGAKNGGFYSTLIGDFRKNGNFYSIQSDFIQMMPRNELISVVIKQQHNCVSDNRTYSGSFIPITHEYLLVWRKKDATMFAVAYDKATQIQTALNQTWRNVVRMAFIESGKSTMTLSEIYDHVVNVAPEKVKSNEHFTAKIRQTLQKHFENVTRGVWGLSMNLA